MFILFVVVNALPCGPCKYLILLGGIFPNYLLLVEVVLVVDFDDDNIVVLFCVARQRVVGSAVQRLVDGSVSRVRVTLHVRVIHWSVVVWALVAHDDGLGTARLGRRPGDDGLGTARLGRRPGDGLWCPRGMMGVMMMMLGLGRENTIPDLTSISCCLLGRMLMSWMM